MSNYGYLLDVAVSNTPKCEKRSEYFEDSYLINVFSLLKVFYYGSPLYSAAWGYAPLAYSSWGYSSWAAYPAYGYSGLWW